MKTLKDETEWKPIAYAIPTEKVKNAVLRFEFIMKKFIEFGDFNSYEGDKNKLVKDIVESLIERHKKLFGDFEK